MTSRIACTLVGIGLAATLWCSGSAIAGLPLDLGLYRASQGKLYLDFDRDSTPDRTFSYETPPERILVADMDGDGIADIVTYSGGLWSVDLDHDGMPDVTYQFGGVPGDIPLLADVDGDGKVDLVIYRNGVWYTSLHRDGIVDRVDYFGGEPGDIPVLGDLNCDGIADRIIYRGGLWYTQLPAFAGAPIAALGGEPGDQPFVADWDGDCNGDLGIFRNGEWLVFTSPLDNPVLESASFGAAGDQPIAGRLDAALSSVKFHRRSSHHGIFRPADQVFYFQMLPGKRPDLAPYPRVPATHVLAADLDGSGKSSLVLYNAGMWLVDHGLDGMADETYLFGGAQGDIPLVGDVDGDGRADLVIYRKGEWYVSAGAQHGRDAGPLFRRCAWAIFPCSPTSTGMAGPTSASIAGESGISTRGTTARRERSTYWAACRRTYRSSPTGMVMASADLIIYRDGNWFVSTDPASGVVSIREVLGGPTDLPVAGNFVIDTTASPVLFAMQSRPIRTLGDGILSPAIADYDRDGRLEPVGGRNDGTAIQSVDLAAAGLGTLFSPGRVNRDCRAADLNGDGILDLVCNTYSPITNTASFARLYIGDGTGHFVEDPAFAALNIRGFGETILAADFNNDGALDLFIPFYSHNDPAEHSYLLINDGHGHFTDVADAAGVALRGVPAAHRVEGAQAVDYDGDGWIDFYVAGRLFRNNGNLTFTDVTAAVGLPGDFDEGIKFTDWNNDGNLDLVIHHPVFGPALWEYNGTRFERRDVMPEYLNSDVYGVNVGDFNGDGREDVVVAGGSQAAPFVLLNNGERFERDPITLLDDVSFGPVSVYDYDGDGAIDLVLTRGIRPTIVARNISPGINKKTLTIEVVDVDGRSNQAGRVVRIRPDRAPGVTMTRSRRRRVGGAVADALCAHDPHALSPAPIASRSASRARP